jgi:hypothetical protein
VFEANPELWFYGNIKGNEMVFGGVTQEVDEEVVAVSVATLANASGPYHTPPRDEWGLHKIGDYAGDFFRKLKSKEFIPLDVAVPGHSLETAVKAWTDGARATGEKAGLAVARSVVFELGADRVRGAILGAKIENAHAAALAPVTRVEVRQGHAPLDPARQPQSRIVELTVPFTGARGAGN